MASGAAASHDLALELHALLRDLDPARWRASLEAELTERLRSIQERVRALRASEWPADAREVLRVRLDELAQVIEHAMPRGRRQWDELRTQLQPAYEALAAALDSAHVPKLRPTNYARNALHVASALTILLIAELLLSGFALRVLVTGGAATIAWTMEIVRRVWPHTNEHLLALFGTTSHPHERFQINSATWYTTALVLLALTGSLLAGAVAVAVLGAGDPVAALVGRRFGRIEIRNGRTLEGSLAFVVAAGLAAGGVLAWFHPEARWPAAVVVALSAAVCGAAAELLTRRVDDNLAIPLGALVGTTISALLVGVPLWS